jgi:outer membrane PBP1 activator LpoA protein
MQNVWIGSMAYIKNNKLKNAKMERLYALGIDTFYLAIIMLQVKFPYKFF